MTGQVKEEILTRFGELGVRIENGAARFDPRLLRSREFVSAAREFSFLDVDGNWQELSLPAGGLAFTWCQVPVVYQLDDTAEPAIGISLADGREETVAGLALSAETSSEIFRRSGHVRRLTLKLRADLLFAD
jgi:hypothetical protein